MAKYYLILAVIISAMGMSTGVKAESSPKAESGKLVNMQFTQEKKEKEEEEQEQEEGRGVRLLENEERSQGILED